MIKHIKSASVKCLSVVSVMLAAVLLDAAELDLTGYLPRHSVIVAGVDLSVMQEYPVGREVFRRLAELTPIPVSRVKNIIFASDSGWKKRTLVVRFDHASTVDKFCCTAEKKKNISESTAEYDVYWFNGKPSQKNFFRMIKLDDEVAGFYNGYPKNGSFELDRRGISPEIGAKLPDRRGIMIWCVGFPQSDSKYVKEITRFDLTLENGMDSNIYLHGNVVFDSEWSAVLANWFFEDIIVMLFYRKFSIPADQTRQAIQALNIVRKKNIIHFSSKNIFEVIPLVTAIVKKQFPDYNAVIN